MTTLNSKTRKATYTEAKSLTEINKDTGHRKPVNKYINDNGEGISAMALGN